MSEFLVRSFEMVPEMTTVALSLDRFARLPLPFTDAPQMAITDAGQVVAL